MGTESNYVFSPNERFHDRDGNLMVDLLVSTQIKTQAVAVSSVTATKLPSSPLRSRRWVRFFNNDSIVMFIGGSDVTTSNGWPVYPHQSETFGLWDTCDVFAIATSGTPNMIVMEGK